VATNPPGITVDLSGPLFSKGSPIEGAAHRAVNELIDLGVGLARRELLQSTKSRRFVKRIRAYRGRGGRIEGFVDAPGTGVMPRWLNAGERSINRGRFGGYGFFDRASRELDRRKARVIGKHIGAAVAHLNGWG